MKHVSVVLGSPLWVFFFFSHFRRVYQKPTIGIQLWHGNTSRALSNTILWQCVLCLYHFRHTSSQWLRIMEGRKDLQQHHRQSHRGCAINTCHNTSAWRKAWHKEYLGDSHVGVTISHEWVATWASWPLILCALPIAMRLLPITATQLGTNSGFTLMLAIWIQ